MKGLKRVRKWVAVVQMGSNRACHDQGKSQSGGDHGSLNQQTDGADCLGEDDEVQKPDGEARLQEELPHVGIVGKFADFGTDE